MDELDETLRKQTPALDGIQKLTNFLIAMELFCGAVERLNQNKREANSELWPEIISDASSDGPAGSNEKPERPFRE